MKLITVTYNTSRMIFQEHLYIYGNQIKSVDSRKLARRLLFRGIFENHSAIRASTFRFFRAGFDTVVPCRIIANTTIYDTLSKTFLPQTIRERFADRNDKLISTPSRCQEEQVIRKIPSAASPMNISRCSLVAHSNLSRSQCNGNRSRSIEQQRISRRCNSSTHLREPNRTEPTTSLLFIERKTLNEL